MASREDIRKDRIEKISILKEAGMNPYPSKTARTISIERFLGKFDEIEKSQNKETLAGRVRTLRKHGGVFFFNIYDGSETIQSYFKKDRVGDEMFTLFDKTVDLGDFVEVTGFAERTRNGTQSIAVESWTMLTKSVQAIPEEHFGLKNEEERFRKRYLDMLLDQDVRDMIINRATFWRETRRFFEEQGFLEVETPTLETTTGGAEAEPFQTHHNDFDIDVFLRISVGELWQKKILASGFEKIFEIGRIYRNEGTGPEHVQEFTNCECYWAYADYEKGMEFVEKLFRHLATATFNTTEFSARGHTFDLSKPFERLDYAETIRNEVGIDIFTASEDEMRATLEKLEVEYEGTSRERLIDSLWKHIRRSISGPAFLTGHPSLISPLSKSRANEPEITERFQVILAGSEVGNGFSELNDPLEQRRRFEEQQKLIDSGDEEAMRPDWEFIEALEYGIPPAFGFGFGERLFAFLSDRPVREIALFPLMKPKEE